MTARYSSAAEQVRLNSQPDSNGCWIWQLTIHRVGYGMVKADRRTRLAHRYSYETFVGPIPEGLQLDHLCRNRACVNPEHLEPVTPHTNIHRSPIAPAAINARKTECPQGHPYSIENTYVHRGGRLCRTCQRARNADASFRAAGIEVAS